MKLRIFIYKPCDSIRELLTRCIEARGHEAAVINFPQTCLQYHSPENACSTTKVCADVIVIGTDISPDEGLTMLEKRMGAGCRGAKNNAIISHELSEEARQRAEKIGCVCFQVPLDLAAVDKWLTEVEQSVDTLRELSEFTIGGTAA